MRTWMSAGVDLFDVPGCVDGEEAQCKPVIGGIVSMVCDVLCVGGGYFSPRNGRTTSFVLSSFLVAWYLVSSLR